MTSDRVDATPQQFCAADINQDLVVDDLDIDDFTTCVIAGGCP